MYCTNFYFDGESSEDHGIIICSFDGSNNGNMDAGSKVDFTTVSVPNSSRVLHTHAGYKEQLSIAFSICKKPFEDKDFAFTSEEQRDIMRWLIRKEFKYICFESDGFENIFYNVRIQAEHKKAGGELIGYNLTCTCDAPWGWSEEVAVDLSNINNKLFDGSDEIGNVHPYTELTAASNGTVSIQNIETGQKTIINNCTTGEKIILDDMMHITSSNSNHKSLYDDFNWSFPEIQNTYFSTDNEYILTNCTAVMKWRESRKAVVS